VELERLQSERALEQKRTEKLRIRN